MRSSGLIEEPAPDWLAGVELERDAVSYGHGERPDDLRHGRISRQDWDLIFPSVRDSVRPMSRGPTFATPDDLLERHDELEEIGLALAKALAREGRVLLIEGTAGIGKTALVRAAHGCARECSMTTLSARGGELESHFPYGVVRQLFEPALRDTADPARRKLMSGAAAPAAAVLGQRSPRPARRPASDTAFSLAHGLYWLTINLAGQAPVLITLDDAHLVDVPSAEFLVYLARRLDGLAVTVLITSRPDEHTTEFDLSAHLAHAAVPLAVVRPEALSEVAVAKLLTSGLKQAPAPAFTAACHTATGGNPFLVHELAAAIAAEGVMPTDQAASRVQRVGPVAVARSTVMRLGRMSPDCVVLARATAVLAGDADLPRGATLAGLDHDQALEALDALIAQRIVRNEGGLEFVHPVVRNAIYDELAPGKRSQLHRRAADLLLAEGAELDAVAGHLLASEPAGSPESLAVLRDAASLALSRGAPVNAVTYLTRALAEGCERELRAQLCYELATASRLAGLPTTVDHYKDARRLAGDPVLRNSAALELAGMLGMSGKWNDAVVEVERALDDLGDRSPELAIRLERLRAGTAAYDRRLVGEFDRRLPILRELVAHGGAAARSLALLLAAIGSIRGEPTPEVVALVERGWDQGGILSAEGEEWAPSQGLGALVACDELERARTLAGELLAAARARGSLLGHAVGTAYQAFIEAREGRLDAAEADIRAALEPVLERSLTLAVPSFLWFGLDVIIERSQAEDIGAVSERIELAPIQDTLSGAYLLEVRGHVRYVAGDATAGIQHLRQAGEIFRTLRVGNPNASQWRSSLALMLGHEDCEAHSLAREELADAIATGNTRAIGVSLRTVGLLEGGASGVQTLEQAVRALAGSPARLEHARALVELGGALRRSGQRAASREPLRTGLDLAAAAGATRLAERARDELAATGAHPRRIRVTGRDALTPSELRVTRLAATGHTNLEIAQALFVTPKTVDTHLTHAYAKLGISSRHQLAGALDRDSDQASHVG